jgi:hypothetical protein
LGRLFQVLKEILLEKLEMLKAAITNIAALEAAMGERDQAVSRMMSHIIAMKSL